MLTPKQQKYQNKWERLRRNKRRFCIIYGSLGWGISTAILTTFLTAIINKEPFDKELLMFFIFNLIGLLIGGYFFGVFLYNAKERGYQRLLELNKEDDIVDPVIGDEWKTKPTAD